MHTLTTTRYFLYAASVFVLLAPGLTLAANPTITIKQESELEVLGSWTLIKPNQESLKGTAAETVTTDSPVGQYTLFIVPPQGATVSIDLFEGGEKTKSVDHTQMSFTAIDGVDVFLHVKLALTHFGNVGVNSVPSHVPFTLQGPNGLKREGVTPITYEEMPEGQYSVQYRPEGCHFPAPQSDSLLRLKSVYFSLNLSCAAFVPDETEEEETHVSTEVKGSVVAFTDVPLDAWFAKYAAAMANKGIITGYKDSHGQSTGLFGPENPVTLAELSKMMHEVAEIDELEITVPPLNVNGLGKWYTKYIASAEERGWVMYQDLNADLQRPATRGEVMVTLLQAYDIPLQWPTGKLFTDVVRRTPFAHAIETAAKAGIVSGATDANGVSTGLFHPTNQVTRAEMSKILVTILDIRAKEEAAAKAAADGN